MARPCSVCGHPDRQAIEDALRRGDPLRKVAERFGSSATALHRHQAQHPTLIGARAKKAKGQRSATVGEKPRPKPDPAPSATVLVSSETETEILRLRRMGLSPRRIAANLGMGRTKVTEVIQEWLEQAGAERAALAGQILDLELERLDELQESLWARATDPGMASVDVPALTESGVRAYDGQDKAAALVLRISERRAKLLGWEMAPAKPKDEPAPEQPTRPEIRVIYPPGVLALDGDPAQPAPGAGPPANLPGA